MNTLSCVVVYSLLVAGWAPRLLARLSRTGRSPRLLIAGWLTATTSVLAVWLATAIATTVTAPEPFWRLLASVAVTGLVGRLAWASGVTIRAAHAVRTRQHHGLAHVGRRDPRVAVIEIDSPHPMVYCLPGRGGLVVVTTGARAALTSRQLHAVLAHERAHLAGRHHLLRTVGHTLTRALPHIPLFA